MSLPVRSAIVALLFIATAQWTTASAQSISQLPAAPNANLTDILAAAQVNPTSPTGYATRRLTLQQIQALIIGGGAGGVIVAVTNSTGSTIPPGAAVYVTGNTTIGLARSNVFSTSGVLGIANASIAPSASGFVGVAGILTLTTVQWDAVVTGESGGLTAGVVYFLDPSIAGKLTATAPSTAGQVVTLIGRALSSTTLVLTLAQPIQL